MNYIYDIILNFTDTNFYYDFYEWKQDDKLINIKKIPIFKVDKKTINDFINNSIKVDKKFLKTIEGKSIQLKKDKYDYLCLLSNTEKTIGVDFDNNGKLIYISSMLIDEENDANNLAKKLINHKIIYKKNKKNKINYTMLREDYIKKIFIERKIKNIYNNKSFNELKYLYFEIFNKIGDDYNSMYKDIIDSLNSYADEKYNSLYEVLINEKKLIEKK